MQTRFCSCNQREETFIFKIQVRRFYVQIYFKLLKILFWNSAICFLSLRNIFQIQYLADWPFNLFVMQELSRQRYLKAVVKEGMRLYPPALGNIRNTSSQRIKEYLMILCKQNLPKTSLHFQDPKNYWIQEFMNTIPKNTMT